MRCLKKSLNIKMRSLFESLFTTKDIVRAKYPYGWVGWLYCNGWKVHVYHS